MAAAPKPVAYKVKKGDFIDELFARALAKCGYNIRITRIEKGKYIFGTKKIQCVEKNGMLTVRVGGGFMPIDQFIEDYAEQEWRK